MWKSILESLFPFGPAIPQDLCHLERRHLSRGGFPLLLEAVGFSTSNRKAYCQLRRSVWVGSQISSRLLRKQGTRYLFHKLEWSLLSFSFVYNPATCIWNLPKRQKLFWAPQKISRQGSRSCLFLNMTKCIRCLVKVILNFLVLALDSNVCVGSESTVRVNFLVSWRLGLHHEQINLWRCQFSNDGRAWKFSEISISFTLAAAPRLAGLAGTARIWSGFFGLGFLGACYVVFRTQHPRRLIAEPDSSEFYSWNNDIVWLLVLDLQHFMYWSQKSFWCLMLPEQNSYSKNIKTKTDWFDETWIRTTALQVPCWSLWISLSSGVHTYSMGPGQALLG